MSYSEFNCKNFVPHTCKAYCCGNVPIKKESYYKHFFNQQRPVIEEKDLGDSIFPKTSDGICAFLDNNYQCLIYDDRPQQCRDFGCTDKPFMACPYMHTNGKPRTKEEQEQYKIEMKKNEAIIKDLYENLN